MDYEYWTIRSHVIPSSHIRGYARGVRNPREHRLKLSLNQYIPKGKALSENAATIIFCHGVGSTKESYEPFFAWLHKAGLEIRSIWAADIAWHGASYSLNEAVIGDEPHWDDTARDILHMINTFQEDMPPPVIGMGQSWGGYPIFRVALMHPRLFVAIVGLEPYLLAGDSGDMSSTAFVTEGMMRKKDKWNSLQEARVSILRNSYFQRFDKDVFEKVMKHDFKVLPDGSAQLVTPKAQEVATMVRIKPQSGEFSESLAEYTDAVEQSVAPGFYRLEPALIKHEIRNLRPATLYVFGTQSLLGTGLRKWVMANTGTGPYGNGGRKSNMVAEVDIKGASHPMPLEMPKETAEAMVPWLQTQIQDWSDRLDSYLNRSDHFWTIEINPKWMKSMMKL